MRWEIVDSIVTGIDGPDERQKRRSPFTLDASRKPKRIVMMAWGGEAGRRIEGIYELEGNKLRICFGEEDKELPTEFKVEKGADMGLIELERVLKPDEKASEIEKLNAAELKKMQGKWRLIKMENERGVAPAKEIESMPLEIVGNEFSFLHEERGEIEKEIMTIILDSSKSPKEITFTALNGPAAVVGKIAEGIYEWKGDQLRISMANFGKPRPAATELVKVAKARLMEFERIPDAIRDLKDLAGEWRPSVVRDGKERMAPWAAAEIHRDVLWVTEGDKTEKMVLEMNGGEGTFDMTPITGPVAVRGKPMLGRFTWKDGELTVYSGKPGAGRPAEAKAGPDVTVAVMERVKKR